MSIINEALKKTEQNLQKNNDKEKPSSLAPLRPKPFLLYVLILLAGLLLGNFIFTLLKNKTQTIKIPEKINLANIQTPNLVAQPISTTQAPEEKKSTQSNFILNGIFFSENDSYALVNNQIVRENDYVDGAKVGLITANSIELDSAGQIITLTTTR